MTSRYLNGKTRLVPEPIVALFLKEEAVMTLIIHAVGDGDLGIDVFAEGHKDKKEIDRCREERIGFLRKLIDSDDCEKLASAIFNLNYSPSVEPITNRFPCASLWQVFSHVGSKIDRKNGLETVHLRILYTPSGDRSTKEIFKVLEESLKKLNDVRSIQNFFGFDLEVLSAESSLKESEMQKLKIGTGGADVFINGNSGSTLILLSALGIVDVEGLPWHILMANSRHGVREISREDAGVSAFYWLRRVGRIKEALDVACSSNLRLPEAELNEMREMEKSLDHLQKLEDGIDENDLARVALVDMVRADSGAGIPVRAWVQKHYENLLRGENPKAKSVFWLKEGSGEEDSLYSIQLGEAIKNAERRCGKKGSKAYRADKWLADQTGDKTKISLLNEVGKGATHEASEPSSEDIQVVFKSELREIMPSWMKRPDEGSVLVIFAQGNKNRPPTVVQRILGGEASREIVTAFPRATLRDKPSIPIDFTILHSSNCQSCLAAIESRNSVPQNMWDRWKRDSLPTLKMYEDTSDTEKTAPKHVASLSTAAGAISDRSAEEVFDQVEQIVRENLEQVKPAVVILGATGQKEAVFGALCAAKSWCAMQAAPLFLVSFVDEESKDDWPRLDRKDNQHQQEQPKASQYEIQLHRFAMGRESEKALLETASSCLDNFELLSAMRVLAAGDADMRSFSEDCECLRNGYLGAYNANKTEKDMHIETILGVLEVVKELWSSHSLGADTRVRLAVMVGEMLKHCPVSKKKVDAILNRPLRDSQSQRFGKRASDEYLSSLDELTSLEINGLQCLFQLVRNRVAFAHGEFTADGAVKALMKERRLALDFDDYKGLLKKMVESIKIRLKELDQALEPPNEASDESSETHLGSWKCRYQETRRKIRNKISALSSPTKR